MDTESRKKRRSFEFAGEVERMVLKQSVPVGSKTLPEGMVFELLGDGVARGEAGKLRADLSMDGKVWGYLVRKDLLQDAADSERFTANDSDEIVWQKEDSDWEIQRVSAQKSTRFNVKRILAATAVGLVVLAVVFAVDSVFKGQPISEVPPAVAAEVEEVLGSGVSNINEVPEMTINLNRELRYTDLSSGPHVPHPSRGSMWVFKLDDKSCPYGIIDIELIHMDNGLVGYSTHFSKASIVTLIRSKYVDDPVGDFSDPFPSEKEKAFKVSLRAYAQTFGITLDEAKRRLSSEGVTIILDHKPTPDKPSASTSAQHHSSSSSADSSESYAYGNVNGRISQHDTTFLLQFENSGSQYYVHGKIIIKESAPNKRITFNIQQYISKAGSNRKDIVLAIMKKAYESLTDSQLKQLGLYYGTKRRVERNWLDFD